MNLTFVESRVFSRRWHERLGDEELRTLQNQLLENPRVGDPIPGCGILRKVRPERGMGKRGGVRVIYLHTPESGRIDLLLMYGKDRTDSLTPDDLKAVCLVAREIRKALLRSSSRAGQTGQE